MFASVLPIAFWSPSAPTTPSPSSKPYIDLLSSLALNKSRLPGLRSPISLEYPIKKGAKPHFVLGGSGSSKPYVPEKPKTAYKLIKREYKNFKCITELFRDIDFSDESRVTEQLAKPQTNAKGTYQAPSESEKFSEQSQACLTVWWDKKTFEGGYWKGQWGLMWVLSDGKHGRILFNNVTTEDGKLYSDGIAYQLFKKGRGKWKIKGKVKKEKTEVTKGNKDDLIIKPSDSMKSKTGEYWGAGDLDPDKVCSKDNSNCKILKSTSKSKNRWKSSKEGCQDELLYNNWTSNISSWTDSQKGLFPSHTLNYLDKVKGCF